MNEFKVELKIRGGSAQAEYICIAACDEADATATAKALPGVLDATVVGPADASCDVVARKYYERLSESRRHPR
jgi:hypothetical protein